CCWSPTPTSPGRSSPWTGALPSAAAPDPDRPLPGARATVVCSPGVTMRDLSRRVVFVLLTLAAAGCGGGGRTSTPSVLPSANPSPAPTPTPAPTTGTVIRDGWTEEEIAVSTSPASPGTG